LLFGALVGVDAPQAHDAAQRLDVEALRLGLGIDLADVARDLLLLVFEPLDALDKGAQMILDELRLRHRVLPFASISGGGGVAGRGCAPRRMSRQLRKPRLHSATSLKNSESQSSARDKASMRPPKHPSARGRTSR